MKGNVVMKSKDRELFGVTIKQNVNNEFLSLSDLQDAYDVAKAKYGWSARRAFDVMQTKIFKERLYYVLGGEEVVKSNIVDFIETLEKEGVPKVLKSLGVYKTTGARNTKETFISPDVFVMLAMELNPMIYATAVKWLKDSLIVERIDACNGYRPMMEAIGTVVECPDYKKYAVAINKKVFGKHEFGMRNTATTEELRKVSDIEKFLTRLIEQGIIDDDKSIMRVINTYKI